MSLWVYESVQEHGDATSVALQNVDKTAFLHQRLKSLLLITGSSFVDTRMGGNNHLVPHPLFAKTSTINPYTHSPIYPFTHTPIYP